MKTNPQDIEELVKMLDSNMAGGTGRVHIKVNNPGSIQIDEVNVVTKMDCDVGDTACKIPNLPMEDDDQY